VHVLVDAFRRLPRDTDAELLVHGLPLDSAYERQVRRAAEGDPRIKFLGPVGRADVAAVIAGFDVLAVPSIWLETGPLVVLEALAAGTPVVGSDLGGIAEVVTPGSNGWLLPHGDVAAWAAWLGAYSRRTIQPLDDAVARQPPRSMGDVADDMIALYQRLCADTFPRYAVNAGARA
jgi:glycosyltransferase involved in cell wall biosynthesis